MILVIRRLGDRPMLVRWAWLLAALFLVRLILGVTTWVTMYGWPRWFVNYFLTIEYTVVAEGRLQTLATTTHVAVGALNLLAASSLALWSFRLRRPSPKERRPLRGWRPPRPRRREGLVERRHGMARVMSSSSSRSPAISRSAAPISRRLLPMASRRSA